MTAPQQAAAPRPSAASRSGTSSPVARPTAPLAARLEAADALAGTAGAGHRLSQPALPYAAGAKGGQAGVAQGPYAAGSQKVQAGAHASYVSGQGGQRDREASSAEPQSVAKSLQVYTDAVRCCLLV